MKRDKLEDKGVAGMTILKWILSKKNGVGGSD